MSNNAPLQKKRPVFYGLLATVRAGSAFIVLVVAGVACRETGAAAPSKVTPSAPAGNRDPAVAPSPEPATLPPAPSAPAPAEVDATMERALGELVREQAPRGAVAIGSLVAGQFRSATERIAREAELPGKGCYLVVGVSLGPAKPVHARLDVSGESLEEAACTRVDGSRRARLVLGLTGGRGVAAAQIFRVR